MNAPAALAAARGRAAAAPALALLLNAFVWGVSWLPFRQLALRGWHPLWTTALVYLVVVAAMLALRWRRCRGFFATRGLVPLALAAGLTNAGFNWGVTQGDVVRVVLLFYLMPLWSALLAWPMLGERPTPGALLRVALALGGVVIVLKTPEVAWPVPASLPDWLGVGAGFCFALTNILLRRARHASGELRAVAMFGGCMAVALALALGGTALGALAPPPLAAPGGSGWAALLGGGFILANVCLQYAAVRLPASVVSVIMLSEVLFASASSVVLGAAVLAPRIGLGGALIVVAAVWSALAPPPRAALACPSPHA